MKTVETASEMRNRFLEKWRKENRRQWKEKRKRESPEKALWFKPQNLTAVIDGLTFWYRTKEGWWVLSPYSPRYRSERKYINRIGKIRIDRFVKHCLKYGIPVYKCDTGQVW